MSTDIENRLRERNNCLEEENDRLQKELDKVYQRPPSYNPITAAFVLGPDVGPAQIGIENIEMAVYKQGRPAYIFTMTKMNDYVLKVISALKDEGFKFVSLDDEDLDRPFPQEQAEGLTVAMDGGFGACWEEFSFGPLGGDIVDPFQWESAYELSKGIADRMYSNSNDKIFQQAMEKLDREKADYEEALSRESYLAELEYYSDQ